MSMKAICVFVSTLILCGCASTRQADVDQALIDAKIQDLLVDERFVVPDQGISIQKIQLLDLPPSVRRYLDDHVIPLDSELNRFLALRAWIFEQFALFEYNSSQTLSSVDLFNSRQINCLSFSILFASAARYVGLPVRFQLVYAPPYWDSNQDVWIFSQHINVTGDIEVEREVQGIAELYMDLPSGESVPRYIPRHQPKRKGARTYVIDLNPAVVSVPFKVKELRDNEVLSLFYSNDAMEALLSDNIVLAYLYTKEAIKVDSLSSPAWNNLGVLYKRKSLFESAKEALEMAILTDDKDFTARSNLAGVYDELGEVSRADELRKEVASYRNKNPYYHYALGEQSLEDQKILEAIDHFAMAIELKHNEHFFYRAMAEAKVKIGDYDAVEENLKNARIYAKGPEKSRYSGKMKAFEEALLKKQSVPADVVKKQKER